MDGQLILDGIKNENRIVGTLRKDPNMIAVGLAPDLTQFFYDFSPDGNQITASSEDMMQLKHIYE